MVYVHLEGTISIWLFTHFCFSFTLACAVLTFQSFYYSKNSILQTQCLEIYGDGWCKSNCATVVWSSLACFEIPQICLYLLTKFVSFSAGILSSRSSWEVTCLSLSVQLFYAEYLLIPLMRWFSCTIWRRTWCVLRSPAKRFKFPLKESLVAECSF